MSTREDIREALTDVDGVSPAAYRPTVLKTGDAWPLLSLLERGDGWAFTRTWRVFVVLPQDERAASDRFDALVPDLLDALEPIGYVDRFEPVKIETSGGDLLALAVTLRSE